MVKPDFPPIASAANHLGRWRFAALSRTPIFEIAIEFVDRNGGGFTSMCPLVGAAELIELLVMRGDTDAALEATKVWHALLAAKHGIRGLEYPPPAPAIEIPAADRKLFSAAAGTDPGEAYDRERD